MAFPDLQVDADSGLNFAWTEPTSHKGLTSDASFGQGEGGQRLGLQMIVQFDDLMDDTLGVIPQLLGYSYLDGSKIGSTRLRRYLPYQHPRFSQLWCTRIVSAVGLKPMGNTRFRTGPIAKSQFVLLTLQFTRPKYNVLYDDEITLDGGVWAEWKRYTDRFWTPSVRILSREGMQLKFQESQDGGGVNRPKGTLFPGSVGQQVGRVKLTRRWYQIPERAIYDSNGYPSILLNGQAGALTCVVGSVNSTDFLGMPAGTLLYMAPEIIPTELPMPPELMGLGLGELYFTQYDVVFHFDYFDPPRGNTANPTRGHNLFPWAGDNRWYLATSQNGGLKAFTETEFRNLWTTQPTIW